MNLEDDMTLRARADRFAIPVWNQQKPEVNCPKYPRFDHIFDAEISSFHTISIHFRMLGKNSQTSLQSPNTTVARKPSRSMRNRVSVQGGRALGPGPQ